MGYETKIFLCERLTFPRASLNESFIKIAMVDLSKVGGGELSEVFQRGRERTQQRVKDGGEPPYAEWRSCQKCETEDPIIKDPYGDYLGVNTADEVLVAMKRANEKEQYRRFDIAIAMIEAAQGKFRDLVILSYGH